MTSAADRQDVLSPEDQARVDRLEQTYFTAKQQLRRVIVGQEEAVDQILTSIFAGGHCLIVGVPGLAKTLMVSSLAQILSLTFRRIQFTPDLLPSDITGTEIIASDPVSGERGLTYIKGPIFANIVLADEINRTPPKTQAALMEAMEEQQVTSGGKRYPLESPFYVLATQNPIEQEGTYPLPVAQLDRFMFQVFVDYPSVEDEERMINLTTTSYHAELEPLIPKEELIALQRIVRRVTVSEEVLQYAVALARGTRVRREEVSAEIKEWLSWGVGPRGPQHLIVGGKALAMLHGRTHVLPEDIRAVVHPAFRHRLILTFHAEAEGVTPDQVITRLLHAIPSPDGWEGDVEAPKSTWARLLGRFWPSLAKA
ncbi:MAG: MoxR family ATPase [Planctomycetota bacterium]|nr:MoxR family ATPase [Planctomycetota bacterium]